MHKKISFKNDYSEGAHPSILQLLMDTNLDQEAGYGEDRLSQQAKEKIHRYLNNPEAELFFVSGGTQANLLVISHLLKPFEAVIAADTGHISVHETGAIENCGHKICLVKSQAGKLEVDAIHELLQKHQDHHMVKPRMVYISQSTELGSLYSKAELTSLYAYCQAQDLFLFIDGARLAVALTAAHQELELADISKLCDAFYIGATKNGGFLGEAIVFNRAGLAENFLFSLKQKGALLAKGRILGAQFFGLFSGHLFFDLARHANEQARRLAAAFDANGFTFASPVESNQLFPILPEKIVEALWTTFDFYSWEKRADGMHVVRLVTSWATAETDVDAFIQALSSLKLDS